jgi:hypothetical protein
MADINHNMRDMRERLAAWRTVSDVVEKRPDSESDPGVNETEVRVRQRRIGNMCFIVAQGHDAFYAQLEAFIQQPVRSQHHQKRVEDWAAFSLGVYEQSSARLLERGIQHESDNLPKEVVETVYVTPPSPPKSWFQRALGL